MVRFLGWIALAASLLSVQATQPGSGWVADVELDTVKVLQYDGRLHFHVPLTLNRVNSVATSLLIEVFAKPYKVQNASYAAGGIPTTRLSSETFAVASGVNKAPYSVFVHLNNSGPWEDYYIHAEVTTRNDRRGTVNSGGDFVIVVDQGGQWTAVDVGVHQNNINQQIIDYVKSIPATGTDITPPAAEEPGRKNPEIIPKQVKENVPKDNTTTTPNPNGTPTPPGGGGGRGKTVIVVTRTTTFCPDPTPPPPPCPDEKLESGQRPRQEKRQDPGNVGGGGGSGPVSAAFISGTFTYKGYNGVVRPIRRQYISLIAELFKGKDKIGWWISFATTDDNGIASFRFSIREGQTVVVNSVIAQLSSENAYRLAVRKEYKPGFTDFSTSNALVDLTSSPWVVDAGKSIVVSTTYPDSEANKGLLAADSFKTVIDYAKKNILVGSEFKPVTVWYPSTRLNSDGITPSTAALIMSEAPNVYINLPQIYAGYPGTIAHELGHYLHYLAIGAKNFPGPGGPHSICDGKTYHEGLTFSEGYATAFGMQALDQTGFDDPYMIFHQGPTFNEDFEVYNCAPIGLAMDEGRIAAAILELVDRKLDVFPTVSNNIGNVDAPFDQRQMGWQFDKRLIFWEIMKQNPQSMAEYWNKLKARLSKTDSDIVLAVLRYHYAESTLFQ